MARTKQTARKSTSGTKPRAALPSKPRTKKVRFEAPVGRPTVHLLSAKLRAKMMRLPAWAQAWTGRAHKMLAGVWVQASHEQVWTVAYKMAKLHGQGQQALWNNLSITMARMAQMDLSSITTAASLIDAVQQPRGPQSLMDFVTSHQRLFEDSSEPCVAWGSVGYAAALKHSISKFGYCKVTGVIAKDRAASLRASMLAWQSSLPSGTKVPPHGIYKHHFVGHQDFAWGIRGEVGVRQTFAAFWDVPDWRYGMVTSLDGCSVVPASFSRRDRPWTHVDQAPKSRGLQCVQGVVSLTDNERRTLVVYPYTHAAHGAFFASRGLGGSSKKFTPIDQGEMGSIAHLRTLVTVGAGDMVVWDSRLFHENEVGDGPGEARCAQYVCMLPSDHPGNTIAQRRKRLECVRDRRTTSHWPVGITKNAMQPQTYGNKDLEIDYSQVTAPVFSTRVEEIVSELI